MACPAMVKINDLGTIVGVGHFESMHKNKINLADGVVRECAEIVEQESVEKESEHKHRCIVLLLLGSSWGKCITIVVRLLICQTIMKQLVIKLLIHDMYSWC